ncbi:hypothetical protein FHS39_004434 [Streptomyces olivoverticillatus]|uniref:Glycosyltransferase RgtA/B/C/D-like domain-containing protein n=1 Tax=Streptomyces olivoverticillatus TaxID=66427 RepID=A0A7W7PLI6_9ACTN|nr:hypothetical protein [Streptomyces olivoverticillatus]MBB4895356.1 hypothetical protein [Streptomyces olivoverticillatus]
MATTDRRSGPLPAALARVSSAAPLRDPRLAAVALAFAVVQLCYAVVHMDLGWDETVYLSQVDPRNPAAFFSAPRSRGISFLVGPVIALTSSPPVLRVALVLLSSAALFAAFKVWEPLLGRGCTALAALLFGGLWITVLSGPEVMPNLWVALTSVAVVGWFLRARHDGPGRRRALLGLAATLVAVTLFRAPDAVWLALPLLAACAAVRDWRRPGTVAAVLGGLALGGVQWTIEAYVRFGGIGGRLAVSSDTEGGMGAHLGAGLRAAYRSLNGPQLCRPCHIAGPAVTHSLWWLLLPVLLAAACALAPTAVTFLPVACGLSLAAPYLLLLDYSAPRFLLPSYALFALPVAGLAARAVRAARPGRPRYAVAGLLTAVLAVHLVVQVEELRVNTADARDTTVRYRRAADELMRLGLQPPCLVTGPRAQPIAYEAGCASAETMGNNRSTTNAGIVRAAASMPTALLFDTNDPYLPPFARTWHPHDIPGTDWVAYVP